MRKKTPVVITLACVLPLLRGCPPAMAQQSSSYVMERVTICGLADELTSLTYDTSVTLAQEGPAGAASRCNVGFATGLGFWSIRGDLPVPIVLHAAKNPSDPQAVDLAWSGNAAMFHVFRSFAPQNVVDPPNLYHVTALCSATDARAFESALVFYMVVPEF